MSRDSDDDVRSRANEVRESRGDEDEGGDGADDTGSPDDSTESEWRFAVDDVGPDGVTEDTATPRVEAIEPGAIEPEHAVFVALGVALTVGVLVFGF